MWVRGVITGRVGVFRHWLECVRKLVSGSLRKGRVSLARLVAKFKRGVMSMNVVPEGDCFQYLVFVSAIAGSYQGRAVSFSLTRGRDMVGEEIDYGWE